jgi:hypothetical protein
VLQIYSDEPYLDSILCNQLTHREHRRGALALHVWERKTAHRAARIRLPA